ncbi:hypothetical protein AHAS_Ahas13G0299800 [Arachis hypogaea]
MVGYTFTFEIWTRIEDYFAKSTKYRIKQLKTQLMTIKKQGLNASAYVSQIKNTADCLAVLEESLTSDQYIKSILEGMNEDYHILLTMVNYKSVLFILAEVETMVLTHDDMSGKFRKFGTSIIQANIAQGSFPHIPTNLRANGGRRGRSGGHFGRGGM